MENCTRSMSRFSSRNNLSQGIIAAGAHGVPAAARCQAPPPSLRWQRPVADEGKVCRSPFSGTVSKISAQAGQTIQVNDLLLILEAMKMEP